MHVLPMEGYGIVTANHSQHPKEQGKLWAYDGNHFPEPKK